MGWTELCKVIDEYLERSKTEEPELWENFVDILWDEHHTQHEKARSYQDLMYAIGDY